MCQCSESKKLGRIDVVVDGCRVMAAIDIDESSTHCPVAPHPVKAFFQEEIDAQISRKSPRTWHLGQLLTIVDHEEWKTSAGFRRVFDINVFEERNAGRQNAG